jgi:PAS domain-containing protein
VQRKRPKDLVLIDARSFAERLSTPTLITDSYGTLVYYNEAAEVLLGRPFAEAGEMPATEWSTMFTVRRTDGSSMPLEEMPGGTALLEHKPAHGKMRITALDGNEYTIAATGLPIFTGDSEPVGVIALFWPEEDAPSGAPSDED